MSAVADIEAVASAWLLRQEEPGWGEAEQRELDAWLAQSAAHQAAFWRLEHGWRRADRLAARPGAQQPQPAARWNWRPAAIAASLAVLVGAGGLWALTQTPRKTYATEIGGHEVAPLPDGSRVELNTDTRLRSEVTGERRAVWLDKGEAYFEVAHDAARPFTVYAGTRKVTVLGTKFSVRRTGEQLQVTVVEGKVRVDAVQPQAATPPAVLTPGQSVIAKGAAALVTPKSVESAVSELSWRQGMLVFDQYTVARAAAEFNRYNRRKIVVTDPEAGSIRISGAFQVENVDGFVDLLEQGYGLRIQKEPEEVKIVG